MKKIILIISLLFACQVQVISQKLNKDSLRIDSLKKILLVLKDTSRINCLNEICEAYESYMPTDSAKEMIENVFAYASQANRESIRLNYKYGEAFSLIHLAWAERANKRDSISKK